jgi:hypothetical protein
LPPVLELHVLLLNFPVTRPPHGLCLPALLLPPLLGQLLLFFRFHLKSLFFRSFPYILVPSVTIEKYLRLANLYRIE